MKLSDLFSVKNGIATTDLSIQAEPAKGLLVFLRPASTQQSTIAGFVTRESVGKNNIWPSGSLFVSTNGEGSHSYAYVSRFEFAANSDVSVLVPRVEMSLQEKAFYAKCITLNRWRFSYGRKPKGKRLKEIELPDSAPEWVKTMDLGGSVADICRALPNVRSRVAMPLAPKFVGKSRTTLADLFEVVYGTNMELVRLERDPLGINFISRTAKNNGVSAKVAPVAGIPPIKGPVLTVAGGGSVLETFVQTENFYSGRDLFYLRPKRAMSKEELLFYCACIRANRFRYSYGRQANRTLRGLVVPDTSAIPSWVYGAAANLAREVKQTIKLR